MSENSLKHGAKNCNIGCCVVEVFFELPEDHLGIETCSTAERR